LITNSPAQDSWAIEIDTVPITGPPSNSPLYISFLPNGSIDGSQTKPADLEKATTLLEPTIAYLHNQTTQQFDYWELINWLYVSFYWTVLADLGQIAPTIYLNGNLSLPITLPSTNNIFTNVTLFNRYSLYLQHTVLPILGMTDSGIVIPSFDQSSMELPRMTFIQSYSCMERHLKTPLEFLISVVVADYALIMGGYNLAIFIAAMVQRRRNRDGEIPRHLFLIVREFLRRMFV
jgi:hypothetical protein